ncbi:MAG: CopD family protein [Burkholderiaceae bacterium]
MIASVEAYTWLSIAVKAVTYVATLLAVGSVLASAGLRGLAPDERSVLSRTALVWALVAAVFSVLRLPIRAGYLAGGSLQDMLDPALLQIVAESPLGSAVTVRLVGLLLIAAAVLLRAGPAMWVASSGALLTCASFALRGHALGDPRLILATLVTLHIGGLAFWIGSLAPLARRAGRASPVRAGALADEFGRKAAWIVAGLIIAGAITLWQLGLSSVSAVGTPYGQLFTVKLLLVAVVLGLAALNRFRLTPRLLSARPEAGGQLRRSIGIEAAVIVVILLTTAVVTTVATPPRESEHAAGACFVPRHPASRDGMGMVT